MKSQTLATIAVAVVMALSVGVNAPADTGPDYLVIVKAYANTMIEQGRDTYGQEHTPLFAAGLNRKTFEPGNFPGIQGIRGGDRATTGANPMHDENLYQVLYAISILGVKDAHKIRGVFLRRITIDKAGIPTSVCR